MFNPCSLCIFYAEAIDGMHCKWPVGCALQACAASAAEEAAEQLRLEQVAEACAARREALTATAQELRAQKREAAAPLAPRREAAETAHQSLQQQVQELR